MSNKPEALEAILHGRKGEPCPSVTGFQHKPLEENAWLVRGNRGPVYITAPTADAAIAIYEDPNQ